MRRPEKEAERRSGFCGEPRRNLIREGIGRVRVLTRRLLELREAVGISRARVPISLLFFVYFSVAHAAGSARGRRGEPEPFADF